MPSQNDNVINLMDQQRRQQWATQVDTSVDDNPDEAARANDLAEATGADPGAVYENRDEFERTTRQNMANQVVDSDPYLQRYIASHPLAAKISNDDYGNLTKAGESYKNVANLTNRPWYEIGSAGIARGIQGGTGTLMAGLGRMLNSDHLTGIGQRILSSIDTDVPLSEEDQRSISSQVGEGIGQMLSLLPEAVAGGVPGAALTMGVQTGEGEAEKAEKAGHPEEAANVFTGGFAIGTGLGLLPLGTLEKVASKAEPGLANFLIQRVKEAGLTGLALTGATEAGEALNAALERETFDPKATYSPDIRRMVSNLALGAILGPSFGAAKSFVDAGEPIPYGTHPLTDRITVEKTKVDNEALDQALKDAGATNTKERAPAMLATYLKFHPGATMGIDGAKVLEMYGDKAPSADDGMLGWVPNIRQQLQSAAMDGSDIQIPMADYVAHVDPKFDKEVHDFRRVDPNGLTLDDVKNLASDQQDNEEGEEYKVYNGAFYKSPVPVIDSLRKQTGMDKILPEPAPMANRYDPAGGGILPKDYDPTTPVQTRTAEGGQTYHIIKEYKGSELLKNANPDLFDRPGSSLYKFFANRIGRIAGDIPVQVVSNKEMVRMSHDIWGMKAPNAFFYMNRDTGDEPRVVTTEDTASGALGQQYASHMIIHELAHAASMKHILDDPVLSKDLLDIRDETIKWIRANDPDLINNPTIAYGLGLRGNTGTKFDPHALEYIAQAYSEPDFQDALARVPLSKELAERIGKPQAKSMWEAAKHIVKKAFDALMGKSMPPSALDAMFTLGSRFEALHHNPDLAPETEASAGKLTEPEEPPTPEERQLFRDQKTLGYTKKHWDRIRKKIAIQKGADSAFQREQIEKDARRRRTDEWKQNETAERPEAAKAIQNRPDIAADRYLRMGDLYGTKVTRQRLDQAKLTKEQKALLDPEHYTVKGLDPENVAGMFGYRSGQSLIEDLAALHADRQREGLTSATHFTKLIDTEVERRMRAKYGSIEQQVLEDAKDHVINDGQWDLLHEDTLRIAQKFGFEATPWSKSDIQRMAQSDFDDGRAGDVKSTRIADNTGRIGRKIEAAENAGDAQEALRLAQQREISFYKTIEARKFEKQVAKFETLAKRHAKRELASFKDPDAAAYHDFIQILLSDVGYKIRGRQYQDVVNETKAKGFNSFQDFIDAKEAENETIPVYDGFFDNSTYKKPFDNLSVGEAKSFMNVIKALDKYGREAKMFNKEGELRDLTPILEKSRDEVKSFDLVYNPKDASGAMSKVMSGLKYFDASLRNAERLFNRFDRDDPRGPLNQYIVRPMTEASNYKEALLKRYGKILRDLGDIPGDLHKGYDPPIVSPSTGLPLTRFTQRNKLALMLHMGSEENWDKLTKGWNVDPKILEAWVMQNSTKEDWKWVNGVWRMFDQIKGDLDGAYRRTTGTPPGTKHSRTIQTPYGTFEGGYFPLSRDKVNGTYKGKEVIPGEENFFQTAIPNPHAKTVTGVRYPVSMDLDIMPSKIQQMAHDIAFREPLHEVQKVLRDKEFRQAIRDHYGVEYDQSINDWLKFVAHAGDTETAWSQLANNASNFVRQNTIGMLVGLGPGTVLKHGPTALVMSAKQVGAGNLLKAYASLFKTDPKTGDSQWTWAIKNSEELQRRERYWQETFGGTYKDLTKSSIRDHIIQWGAKPVAFSDKLSAVPMWIAAFNKATSDGETFGEARFEADRAVRFAHGSTAQTNLPEIARGRGIHAWFTSLYGFFGTMMQNRMELAFQVNDTWKLVKQNQLKEAAKRLPIITAMTMAYVVWPTVVEEYVTGLWTDDRRGWLQHIAWATASGLANSTIGARDLVHMLEYGNTGEGGLLDAAVEPFQRMVNDAHKGKQLFSRQYGGNLISDILNMTGPFLGTPKEVGNVAKYGWDTLIANNEHPHTGLMKNWHQFGDLGLGLTRGKQKYTVKR